MKINWFNKPQYSTNELRVIAVAKKLLEDPESKFMLAETEYSIVNREKEVYMFISNGSVVFANHRFYMEERFPLKVTEKLMKMVKTKTLSDIKSVKKEVLENKKDIYSSFYKEE